MNHPIQPPRQIPRPTRLGALLLLASLACLPGLAQTTELLHETIAGTRDNYTGVIGCKFQVGSSNVVVSHLGIYDDDGAGFAVNHNAGIFRASDNALLGSVAAASATSYYLTNSYQWIQLNPPLLLASNTTYIVASDVISGDGDVWGDAATYANWNARFIGGNVSSSQNGYSAGGASWPSPPTGFFGNGQSYGNVSLGFIAEGPARVGVAATNIAVSLGQPINLVGFASGATNINYQWYKGVTALTGKTNATLSIATSALTDSGTYSLAATNGLGGAQSATVTVSVTAVAVGIAQSPTNLTVFANFPAAFSVVATGSPAIYYQWNRNGTPIPGATNSSYSFNAVASNSGDVFTCVASNYFSGTPHTATSGGATLTVTPNLVLPSVFLHSYKSNIANNGYVGCLGGSFVTGPNPTVVTHLGFYAANYTDATHATLIDDHPVYIFNNDYTIRGSVVVSNGVGLPVVNGYIWAKLNPAVTLAANTTYILGADTSANDPSGDTYVVSDWDSYYTVPANASQNAARYNNSGQAPYFGGYSSQMYSAPNMAILQEGAPAVSVSPTNVTQYVGFGVDIAAVVNGAPAVTGQWFKSPSTPTGKTNAVFSLSNAQLGDSGTYYLRVTNGTGTAQSENVVINIIPPVGPSITQEPVAQNAYVHSTVNFTVVADGTPTLSYQWQFNSAPIPGATNATLTLTDVSTASAGNYRAVITNPYGSTNSAAVSLAVITVPWGSYASSVMTSDLIAYYRFTDVNSGFGVATNQGSLGFAYDGTYEGGYASMSGPTGMSHFEPGNQAVLLDGLTSDVAVPALNVTVTEATIAAWVYAGGGQVDNSTIYNHRGGSVLGLSVFGDTNTVKYTWDNNYYSFQTGLEIPTNEWALVAMSITPTHATVYLRDASGLKAATNTAPHAAATLSSASYVGWDSAGGALGRRWTGGIDEVMIFKRALSAVEMNALYLGVPGTANLRISSSGGNVTLTWPGGKLLEANDVLGPWSTNAATSPLTVPATAAKKFYRVQLQP